MKVRSPQRHAQPRLSIASNIKLPGKSCIDEAPHEAQAAVRIAYIQLVIPKLMSKPTRNIGLQVTDVPASIQQVGWPDANQPFEDSSTERRMPFPYILEFFTIACITNVGKAPKNAVDVMTAQQFTDRSHISL